MRHDLPMILFLTVTGVLAGWRSLTAIWKHTTDLTGVDLEALGLEEGQATVGGIDMTVRRNAFGRQVDSYEEDLDAPALGASPSRPLHAVFIRAPWVESVGEDVEVLATTRAGRAGEGQGGAGGRIVAVRQGPLLATSFHPEGGGESRVHDVFVAMVTHRA